MIITYQSFFLTETKRCCDSMHGNVNHDKSDINDDQTHNDGNYDYDNDVYDKYDDVYDKMITLMTTSDDSLY